MPNDKFGIPFFYPSKAGGFFYQMSDNPKNDSGVDWPSEMSFSGSVATMHPNGPTDFGIGKNIKGFSDSIGGCKMDFKATQQRGYAYKSDDARDVEIKCLAKFSGIDNESGFSISACTGHHSGSGCCQGFAYMSTTEITHNPSDTRFRKEIWHVDYNETPKNSTVNLPGPKINGNGKFVGLGFCRYNTVGQEDTSVTLELWYNPDPETEPTGWFMVNKYVDKPNGKWATGGTKCNGDPDQVGTWSNAQNRLKTNSTGGTIQFKAVTLREINPGGSFDDPDPGGGGGGTAVQRWIKYAMVSGDPSTYAHFTRVTGHEIIETITDPDPLNTFGGQAWGNSTGVEVSDPCEDILSVYGDGLDVEPYWSNSDDRCVVPGLTVADTVEVPSMTNRKGGAVLANGKIYLIYWGLDWSTRATIPIAATLTDKIQNDMLGTDVTYFSKLTQYGVSAPTWGGAAFNTTFPIPSHASITETEGRAAIVDTFNKGLLPIPTDTNEDVYILYVPVGKDITPLGSLSTPGGFHDIWHPSLTPPVASCPTGFHRDTSGACIPDTVSCPAGQHEENGVCVENDTGGGDPAPPTKVKGTFTLLRDINIYRTDACEGSTGGGGSGGRSVIYDAPADNDKQLSDTSTWTFRTRLAAKLNKTGSGMYNKVLKQLDVPLKKVGSPAASPTVTAVIWNASSVVYTSPTEIDPTTLTTSFTTQTFDFSANTHIFVLGDRVGIRYFADSATSDVNYVVGGYESVTTEGNVTEVQLESGVWKEHTDRDFAATMWD